MRFCTVINKSWVAHARALAESLRAAEPQAQLSVLIVDAIDGFIDPTEEPFEILRPNDVEIEDFAAMSVRYEVVELCCALKPSLIAHLVKQGREVVYLDSDMRMYAPLDDLAQEFPGHSLLLTPHLLKPLPPDGRQPDELAILTGGAYNMGFVVARPTDEAIAILDWWSDRLRRGAFHDPLHGMVYDQLWANLMPGLAEHIGILNDPGTNFGYWRVSGHELKRDGNQIYVDGHPLRSFHFTGFRPEYPDRLSQYDNRTSLRDHPALSELCQDFTHTLAACGHETARTWPYEFGAMVGGARLTAELRMLWDQAATAGAIDKTPFEAEGEQSFLRWLGEPVDGSSSLNRYLSTLHQSKAELQKRFPDPDGADRESFLAWAEEQAQRHPQEIDGLLAKRTSKSLRAGLRELAPGETLGAARGETVVCIPVYGAPDLLAACLLSVLTNTSATTRILVADDASPDPAIRRFMSSLEESGTLHHELSYLRQPLNLGFPGNVNAAFAVAAPADVVMLNSDCVVAAGWLEGLRRAAYSDSVVATASALTNHGTILSVPERNRPMPDLPQDHDLGQTAAAVLDQSLRLYPRILTAIGHCVYVRRSALDLVGDFDMAFSPGYGEEVDFSQRCLLQGMVHVAADDVFVLHRAGGSFSEDGTVNPAQAQHERIIEARYPYYQRAQTAAGHALFGPLPRAISAARRAINGLSVTIDARCLGPIITGTQVHTLELIAALSRTNRMSLRVIIPPDIGAYAAERLNSLDHVNLIPHTAVHPKMDKTDIAHRPYQVSNSNDLLILNCAGERQVITHQDLIAYRNPGYFPGYPQWERYQRLTQEALSLADSVVFFSHHAARDAQLEDLVDPSRVRVVYIGVDHSEPPLPDGPQRPPSCEALGDRPMLLCLGTDFRHKNRVFALRLLEALREQHRWDGLLVLAGPRVSHGSSSGEEAAYLATRPALSTLVLTLPAVSEAERIWLLERCTAVLYPTTYEGFGLMPFEAAEYGRPCLFASQTALAETLPHHLATLVPWDAAASAQRIYRLLRSEEAQAAHLRDIRQAGLRYTWQSAAEQLVDVYWATAAGSARAAAHLSDDLKLTIAERDESERKYKELWEGLTPEARVLVGPESPLTQEVRRSLAAIARRPLLRRALLAPIQLLYRLISKRNHSGHEAPTISPQTLALHFDHANTHHMLEHHADGDSARLAIDA